MSKVEANNPHLPATAPETADALEKLITEMLDSELGVLADCKASGIADTICREFFVVPRRS
jgi:hypothetical protein